MYEDLANRMDADMLAHHENNQRDRQRSFLDAQAEYANQSQSRRPFAPRAAQSAAPTTSWLQNPDAVAAATAFVEQHGDVFAFLNEPQNLNNSFCRSLSQYFARNGFLTERQLASVRRSIREAEGTITIEELVAPPALNLRHIPSGTYAVPGGDTRLKVRIDNLSDAEGKWRGWVFVKDGAEYGTGKRYGAQRPGESYKGDIEQQLADIARDPEAASAAYGRLVGCCGVCGRKLEDEDSVARGIGPVCVRKFK